MRMCFCRGLEDSTQRENDYIGYFLYCIGTPLWNAEFCDRRSSPKKSSSSMEFERLRYGSRNRTVLVAILDLGGSSRSCISPLASSFSGRSRVSDRKRNNQVEVRKVQSTSNAFSMNSITAPSQQSANI